MQESRHRVSCPNVGHSFCFKPNVGHLFEGCSTLICDWTFEKSCDFDRMTSQLVLSFIDSNLFAEDLQPLSLKCPTLGQLTLL